MQFFGKSANWTLSTCIFTCPKKIRRSNRTGNQGDCSFFAEGFLSLEDAQGRQLSRSCIAASHDLTLRCQACYGVAAMQGLHKYGNSVKSFSLKVKDKGSTQCDCRILVHTLDNTVENRGLVMMMMMTAAYCQGVCSARFLYLTVPSGRQLSSGNLQPPL